jgi:thymidine kinase
MNEAGTLTLIVGGMFSGKSTEAQRQGKRRELANESVVYVKPRIDNRYDPNSITTHDGNQVEAYLVDGYHEVLSLCSSYEQRFGVPLQNIVIDEIQFFDKDIVKAVNILLMSGVNVIAAGLDIDRFGQPFGAVPTLLCQAEKVIKLQAVCQGCGKDAWVSAGSFDSDQIVEVGEKDKYVPLCRTCFYQKGGVL